MKQTLKWILAGLPLGAVIGTSFLPVAPWVQQALVLITLLWFFAFYLFDCFYLGG
jgi:hypothetical protein